MKMALKPLHDRLVVRQLEAENTTSGGIVIPDKASEKPTQGEVIAVGSGQILKDGKTRALDVKVGDQVIYGSYSGNKIKHEGEELLILKESDVLAIVEKETSKEKAA
jgi:chaperonin GroES